MSDYALCSMTGYAIVEGHIGSKRFRLHLKSVNHRFFDLRWRGPRAWAPWEIKARQEIQKKVKRGSLEFWSEDISVPTSASAADTNASPSQLFFSRLQQELSSLKGISPFLIPPPLRALILSRNSELWFNKETDTKVDDKGGEAEFFNLLENLCTELQQKRSQEGLELAKTLNDTARSLATLRMGIAERLPGIRQEWERNIKKRFTELAQEAQVTAINEERMLTELLLIAERRDVSEELDRIDAHLKNLHELLEKVPENAGKRLEFLIQELHRESTTLGNKVQNSSESKHVMEAKIYLEQMREQCANLL